MPTGGNGCVNGGTRSSRRPVRRRNAAASIDEAIGKHFPLQNLFFFFAFAPYFAGSAAAWLAY
jgi:hypothetical protein